jgi:hypothetical protein
MLTTSLECSTNARSRCSPRRSVDQRPKPPLAATLGRALALGQCAVTTQPRHPPPQRTQHADAQQQRADRGPQRAVESLRCDLLLASGGTLRVAVEAVEQRLEAQLHRRERLLRQRLRATPSRKLRETAAVQLVDVGAEPIDIRTGLQVAQLRHLAV